MIRQHMQRQRRARASSASARDVPVPLPLRGLFAEAEDSNISNMYAAKLHNLRSDGTALQLCPAVSWVGAASTTFQRLPYEFMGQSQTIEIRPDRAVFGALTLMRPFPSRVQAATISSNVLIADGAGPLVRFNGTAFSTGGFSTGAGGPDPNLFDGVLAHHDRPYFWRTGGKLEFWYGDVGAVQGTLISFPLDRLGNITGSIAALTVLTVDAGHGMNDLLCITTTSGDVVIFEGFDPGDPDDWRLTGRIKAASPLSRDSFVSVGSDVWMMTSRGIVSMGEAVRSSVLALRSEMSRPIADDLAALIQEGGVFQVFAAPDGSMILINRVMNGNARQVIYYVESKSWATAEMPVQHFASLGTSAVITGFDGRRGSYDFGMHDTPITATIETSWFVLRRSASVRSITPTLRADGPLTVRVAVLSDRRDTPEDLAEAWQTVDMVPENENGTGSVTLSDLLACDAEGSEFQIRIEVTAKWVKILNLRATVG